MEEDKRLYYVALTRAACKVYLPLFQGKKPSDRGAISNLLFTAIRQAWGDTPGVSGQVGLVRYQPGLAAEEDVIIPPDSSEIEEIKILNPELFPDASLFREGYYRRQVEMSSFTSLSRKKHSSITQLELIFGEEERDREPEESEKIIPELEGLILFPRGAKAGSMLHEVFENIDFREALTAESPGQLLEKNRELIIGLLERYRIKAVREFFRHNESLAVKLKELEEEGRAEAFMQEMLAEETASIVWHVLRLPLKDHIHGEEMTLGNLNPEDKLHELEFYLPFSDDLAVCVPGISKDRPGFLGGFIDLVFRWKNRYYILDWKSNYLPSYDQDFLYKSMEEHKYLLQYKIYSLALKSWLRQRLNNFKEDDFGGVFYIYLRGADKGSGVFYDLPDARDLEPAVRFAASIFEGGQ